MACLPPSAFLSLMLTCPNKDSQKLCKNKERFGKGLHLSIKSSKWLKVTVSSNIFQLGWNCKLTWRRQIFLQKLVCFYRQIPDSFQNLMFWNLNNKVSRFPSHILFLFIGHVNLRIQRNHASFIANMSIYDVPYRHDLKIHVYSTATKK